MQGDWIFVATWQRHNGKTNEAGVPTYDVEDDWDDVVKRWPCSRENPSGNEVQRGSQQTNVENYVIQGDPLSIAGKVDTTCRIVINEVKYNITTIAGTDMMSRVATIQAVVEQ